MPHGSCFRRDRESPSFQCRSAHSTAAGSAIATPPSTPVPSPGGSCCRRSSARKNVPKSVLVIGVALKKMEADMNTRWKGGVHSCIDQTVVKMLEMAYVKAVQIRRGKMKPTRDDDRFLFKHTKMASNTTSVASLPSMLGSQRWVRCSHLT
jgi:hypothetical protein